MHSKIINKIKSNDLKVNLANIIQSCEIIHKDRYLLPFSDHGINHSERMIISLESICKNIYSGTNSLNEYESFILIAAIYLHDIGMQLYRNEVLIDFSKKNNLTFDVEDKAEFVRKYHASLSKYWILSNIYNKKSELKQAYFGDSYLGVLIAKVVESHGIDFIDNPEYNDTSYNGLKIRLGLISSLLCLADTLDCDNRRVYIDKLTHSEIPDYSKIHWFKHYYVNSILIRNNIVTIYYCFPDISKNDLENYKKYFTYQTEYWINYCETKYEKYFETINLNFKIVSHYETSREKCALSKVNFEYIQEEIVKLYSKKILTDTLPYSISIGILKKDNKVLMVKRRIPEGDLKWQFPTGQIKPNETPEYRVVREVKDETLIQSEVICKLGSRLFPSTGTICYYFALKYIDGEIGNGDVDENSEVEWVSLDEYENLITTDIFSKVKSYLNGGLYE